MYYIIVLQGNRSAATSAYQMSLQRSGLPFTQDNVVIYSRGTIYIFGNSNMSVTTTSIYRRECSSWSDRCFWRRNTSSMGSSRRYPSWYGFITFIFHLIWTHLGDRYRLRSRSIRSNRRHLLWFDLLWYIKWMNCILAGSLFVLLTTTSGSMFRIDLVSVFIAAESSWRKVKNIRF